MAKDDGIRDDVRGGVSGGSSAITGGAVAIQSPLLEGLRPECEAVMRALFCRVDRYVSAGLFPRSFVEDPLVQERAA